MTLPRGCIVLFTGSTSAGKSTVAAAWAASRSFPTGHFDHDQARFLLRSGYVSRSAAHADPSLHDEANRQWLLSIAVCEAIAETYVMASYDVALSAFRPPGSWQNCWERRIRSGVAEKGWGGLPSPGGVQRIREQREQIASLLGTRRPHTQHPLDKPTAQRTLRAITAFAPDHRWS